MGAKSFGSDFPSVSRSNWNVKVFGENWNTQRIKPTENSTHIGRWDKESSPEPIPRFDALLPEKSNFERNERQDLQFLVKATFRARFTSDRLIKRGKSGHIDVIDH